MTQPISSLSQFPPLMQPDFPNSATESGAVGGGSFQDLLVGAISETNQLELSANNAIDRSLIGEDISQVEVMSAVKKADLSMRMLLQMRNKVMEAYQELQQLRM
ncbi:flagellar hook-basal body protein FliE [Polystyrenella longa]|uniref:Flagellar hook-basal body complex protein FliE n=1 Tax=Polystyrenella longa TaxID=2528007 RepID=A0A518CIQ4_9PLAN|nr:flagellar hook-basal body complex protein FliE [Polystyrenella longa]QDU79112.1 flagellar hook-basal body protein FliE [Polystyrenella longa]